MSSSGRTVGGGAKPKKRKAMESDETKMAEEESILSNSSTKAKRICGFARGLEAQAILGATDASGELCYLVQWQGTEEMDLVPAREANKKCPHVVISFYESKIFCQPREQ